MTTSSNSKKLLSLNVIGAIVMYLYVLTNYVAQDIVISSHVNSLFLYLFLGIVLFTAISKLSSTMRISPFSIWYILFTVFSLIIMFYAPAISLFSGTFYSVLISLALIFSFQFYITKIEDFKRLAWCYAISGAVTVLMLLVTGNLHGDAGDRLGQETFGNANIFASLMMIAAMYTLWLAVYAKGFKKILPTLFFLADMYALALSGGRKFFVIPFLFLYILLLFKRDRDGRAHIIRVTIVFTVLVILLWLAIMEIPALYNAVGIRIESLIKVFLGQEGGDNSALIREEMRNAAMEEWKQAPLFGYGLDSFKYYARDNLGHFYYSHCNYTELLYSGGIFYFALYYFMFAKIVIEAFRKKALASPYRAFAIAVPISLFVFDFGAVSFNSHHNLILLMLAYKCLSFKEGEEQHE